MSAATRNDRPPVAASSPCQRSSTGVSTTTPDDAGAPVGTAPLSWCGGRPVDPVQPPVAWLAPGNGPVRRLWRGGRAVLASLLLAVAGADIAVAQTALDGFAPPITGGVVRSLEVDPAGKIMLGGAFTLAAGTRRVARLHPDGSRDTSFGFGFAPPSGEVNVVRLIGGGYLVGGNFAGVGYPSHMARLDGNGGLVAGFNLNLNGEVRAIERNYGGSAVYIGGSFTAVNGSNRHRVARLNSSYALDNTFTPPLFDGTVTSIQPLEDGKVLVGGFLLGIPGNAAAGWALFRLNANGSLDTGFVFDSTPQGLEQVQAIAVQKDGQILIAGDFIASQGGQSRRRVARLNPNGSLDLGYTAPVLDGAVNRMQLQPDGRAVIVGSFAGVGLANRIARLNHNGGADTTFAPLLDPNNFVLALALQGDGGVLFGGSFTQVTTLPANRVARIAGTGGLDSTFAAGGSSNDWIHAVAPLTNGDVIVGGSFNTLAGQPRSYLGRFGGATGALSGTFTPTLNGSVRAILVQRDGKLVAGGEFTLVNGVQRQRLVRFNLDGSVDTGFVPAAIPDGTVYALELAPDGKIYIGGSFGSVGGAGRAHFARLNANGSLDTGFSDTLVDGTVRAIAMEWDQYRIYIGGEFLDVSGNERRRVARVWPHGGLNTGFAGEVTGGLGIVYGLAPTPDGGVLVAGDFTLAPVPGGGYSRRNIVRFLQNGSVDTDFFAGSQSDGGANGTIVSVLRREDGLINIGGSFTSLQGETRQRLARLHSDGEVDLSFDVPVTVPAGVGVVASMAALADGRVVLAGQFQQVAGTARPGIARIGNRGGVPRENLGVAVGGGVAVWLRDHDGPPMRGAPELLLSTTCCNPASFQALPGAMTWLPGQVWGYEGFPQQFGTYYMRVRGRIGAGRGAGLYQSPIVQVVGSTQPVNQADLRIVKTVAPAQAPVGATVTFQLAAANLGPNAATGVTIQDLLPAGYTYVSHGNVQGNYVPATGVWTLGPLLASGGGSQATLSIQATVGAQGPYLNTASISGNEFDPVQGNNVSSVAVSVLEPPDDTIFANGFQSP